MVTPRQLAEPTPSEQRSQRSAWPIQVVLADDHGAVRRGLRILLDGEDDLAVIAEVADLPSAVRLVHGHVPRVLVLDLQVPMGSSFDTIRRLRHQVPKTEIVFLMMEPSPLFAQRALDAGAAGVVLEARAAVELPAAIRDAASEKQYISPKIAAALDGLRRAVADAGVSPRETEVLRLIALGHTSSEIAAKLHLSRRTVETHRANILRKLGLRTRAHLVRFALRHNLLGL